MKWIFRKSQEEYEPKRILLETKLQDKCIQCYYKNYQKPHKHKDTTCILQSKEFLFLQINSFFCFLHVVHSYPLFILFQVFRTFYYITATYCSAIIFSRHMSMTNAQYLFFHFCREKKLTGTKMREIMGGIKKGEITRVMFNNE